MVAYKETPTSRLVDDFHFERVVADKRHVVDVSLEVTPSHRDGEDDVHPSWSLSTHHPDSEQVGNSFPALKNIKVITILLRRAFTDRRRFSLVLSCFTSPRIVLP